MNNIVLSSIAKDFESIRSNIEKIVKIKGQEKISKNFEDNRVKQQAYKSRYQRQPTRIKSPGLKDTASSLISGLGGMLKALLAIIGIAGLFSILKSTGIGKYILDFVKNAFSAIIDLIQKGFKFIRDVLFDPDVQFSLRKLATTFFSFIGTLIVASVSLGSSLLRDNEVLETLKNTIVAVFKAVIEGIKASYSVISQLVVENMDTIKQTTLEVFTEITNALILSLKAIQGILAGGLDPRITEGLKEIFLASWDFIKDLFTTEFKDVETGKSFTLAEKSAIWLAKLVGLGALWLVLKGKLIMMGKSLSGLDLSQNCGSCMDLDLPDRRKPPQGKPNLPENKSWKDKLTDLGKDAKEGLKKVGQKVSQYTGQAIDAIKSAAKKAWGTVTEIGAKFYDKAASLGNRVYDYVSRGVKRFANVFRAILKSPAIRDKALQKFGQKIGIEAMKRIGVKLAAAAAGLATGGVVTAIMGVLLAIDIAMLFYAFYEFMFVTTDGETEDGGFYPQIKAEVDKWLRDNPETAPTPVPPPPPAPAPAPTTKAASGNTSTGTSTKAVPASASASTSTSTASMSTPSQTNAAASSAPAPTPAPDYPTNWSASPVGVPAGVAVEKRQVGGLGYGGVRRNTKGVIIHHTGGRGLDVAIQTLQSRKLSYHYLVDRNGKVVQILPDELMGWHAGNTNKKPEFDNSNTVSISMVAKDDTDVTPEQIAAAAGLEGMLAKKYGFPKSNAYGHGEVSSAKNPQEGLTIASAIRSGRVEQTLQNIANETVQNIKPEVQTIPQRSADTIDNASGVVRSGLRTLEDLFLTGRPSFTDMSTTVIQTNTISRPGGNLKGKEDKSFEFLIERQVS
jgi:N-acetylmuramoyl-L-alanine amidase